MTETLQVYATFTWCLFCACLGVSSEYLGQALYLSGCWLMKAADELQDYSLRVSEMQD